MKARTVHDNDGLAAEMLLEAANAADGVECVSTASVASYVMCVGLSYPGQIIALLSALDEVLECYGRGAGVACEKTLRATTIKAASALLSGNAGGWRHD